MIARRRMELAEEGLGEQRRSLEDQNERARIGLETDLMYKLREKWSSRSFQDYRLNSTKLGILRGPGIAFRTSA